MVYNLNQLNWLRNDATGGKTMSPLWIGPWIGPWSVTEDDADESS